jgi:hypothetical protein
MAFARAREAGARVVEELTTYEYGERSGVVEDIGGHRWELTTVRDVAPEEWGGATIAPGESQVDRRRAGMTRRGHVQRACGLRVAHGRRTSEAGVKAGAFIHAS